MTYTSNPDNGGICQPHPPLQTTLHLIINPHQTPTRKTDTEHIIKTYDNNRHTHTNKTQHSHNKKRHMANKTTQTHKQSTNFNTNQTRSTTHDPNDRHVHKNNRDGTNCARTIPTRITPWKTMITSHSQTQTNLNIHTTKHDAIQIKQHRHTNNQQSSIQNKPDPPQTTPTTAS